MTKNSLVVKKPSKPTKVGSEDRTKLAEAVFEGMRSGLSAHKACLKIGLPQSTLARWLDDDVTLAEEYTRAREDLIELIASEIMELSDMDVGEQPDGRKDWAAVQKHKLQVDSRKWLLSKLAPKKYGDKLELTGDPDRPLAIQKIERVVVKS
jgi:hypothetical protein